MNLFKKQLKCKFIELKFNSNTKTTIKLEKKNHTQQINLTLNALGVDRRRM